MDDARLMLFATIIHLFDRPGASMSGNRKSAWLLAGLTFGLASCAGMYDQPHTAYDSSPDQRNRVLAWSSGSAAAVAMPNGNNDLVSVCVLGAAFARTGTTDNTISLVTPKGQFDGGSATSAGALLLRNAGQTATYLDTGMFHLCMMYAQAFITTEENRAALLEKLFSSSVEVSKTAVQFAPIASLQPDKPTAPVPSDPAASGVGSSKAATPADSPASAASADEAASAAAGKAKAAAKGFSGTTNPPTSADARQRDLNNRKAQAKPPVVSP